MADEKQISAIAIFGKEPPREWGQAATTRVRRIQDWAYLVQQISYFDTGKTIDDDAAKKIGKLLRSAKHFPNSADWSKQVNAAGAHEKILQIIRDELAATVAATVPQ